jgi:hypothetical protein
MSAHKRHITAAMHRDDSEPEGAGGTPTHDELPFVSSIHPSPTEVVILDVARCFCFGWANGDIAAWDHAFELGEEHCGPVEGPAFVARVIALMRTLLKERRCGLRYMPVRCSRLCPDEETLMRAVQSAIRGDADSLRIAVAKLTLTRRPEKTRTLAAAHVLGVFCHHTDLAAGPDAAAAEHRVLN